MNKNSVHPSNQNFTKVVQNEECLSGFEQWDPDHVDEGKPQDHPELEFVFRSDVHRVPVARFLPAITLVDYPERKVGSGSRDFRLYDTTTEE